MTASKTNPTAFDKAIEDDAAALQHAADAVLAQDDIQAALADENRDDSW